MFLVGLECSSISRSITYRINLDFMGQKDPEDQVTNGGHPVHFVSLGGFKPNPLSVVLLKSFTLLDGTECPSSILRDAAESCSGKTIQVIGQWPLAANNGLAFLPTNMVGFLCDSRDDAMLARLSLLNSFVTEIPNI